MSLRNLLISLALIAALDVSVPRGQAQDSQTSQPSLAEAARKAKEQQKNQPKPGKVYTDDDLANLKGQISIVGSQPAAAPAPASTEAATKPAAGTPAPVKDEAYWRQKFAEARRALADDSKELDVLQREFNLKQTQYYSSPDVALREQTFRTDLNNTQAEIDKKKEDVAKDNQVLSDLQDELRTSGGEPGWANEDPQPSSQGASAASPSDSSQQVQPQPDQQGSTPDNAQPPAQQPDQSQAPAQSQSQ